MTVRYECECECICVHSVHSVQEGIMGGRGGYILGIGISCWHIYLVLGVVVRLWRSCSNAPIDYGTPYRLYLSSLCLNM